MAGKGRCGARRTASEMSMIAAILGVIRAAWGTVVGFLWAGERQRRRAAERMNETLKERDKIKDEVRNASDKDLVDRLSRHNRR